MNEPVWVVSSGSSRKYAFDRGDGGILWVPDVAKATAWAVRAEAAAFVREIKAGIVERVDWPASEPWPWPEILQRREPEGAARRVGPAEVLAGWLTPEEFRGYLIGTAVAAMLRDHDGDLGTARDCLDRLIALEEQP